jgi:hypothetical protein
MNTRILHLVFLFISLQTFYILVLLFFLTFLVTSSGFCSLFSMSVFVVYVSISTLFLFFSRFFYLFLHFILSVFVCYLDWIS